MSPPKESPIRPEKEEVPELAHKPQRPSQQLPQQEPDHIPEMRREKVEDSTIIARFLSKRYLEKGVTDQLFGLVNEVINEEYERI